MYLTKFRIIMKFVIIVRCNEGCKFFYCLLLCISFQNFNPPLPVGLPVVNLDHLA